MTPFEKTFIAIDLETTGLEPSKAQIIEVAAVKFRNGKEIGKFSSLVNPGRKIPFIVTDITGISDADVANAPAFDSIRDELSEFIGENPIVGHNVAFDLGFLKAYGLDFGASVFDTWKLATIAFTGFPSYSLENLAPRLGLDPGSSHRAYDDARLSGNLFLRICEEMLHVYPRAVLGDVVQFLRRRDWEAEEVFTELLEKAQESVTKDHRETLKLPKSLKKIENAKQLFDSSVVAKAIQGFEPKEVQESIASEMVEILSKKKNALFEVAPDSGRILAALSGSFLATEGKKSKTVFATTNYTLRSATFQKDLNLLENIFGNVVVAVAKSQDSYLCREQLSAFMRRQDVTEVEIGLIVKVLLWLSKTQTGDMEELSLLREQKMVAKELSFEGCAYHHEKCFAYKARLQLEKANLLITDHGTLVKTLSRAEVFEATEQLIVDEGEELEESTTKALSQTFSQNIILEFLDMLTRKAPGIGFLERVSNETDDTTHAICDEARDVIASVIESAILLFGVLGIGVRKWGKVDEETRFAVELPIEASLFEEREGKNIQSVCETFLEKCQLLAEVLSKLDENLHKAKKDIFFHEVGAIQGKLTSITTGISEIVMQQEKRWVNWVVLKPDKDFLIKKAPLSVASFLEKNIFEGRSAVVLARNVTFENETRYIEQRIGLGGFALKQFDQGDVSKFVSLAQVTDMPVPTSPKFLATTHEIILETLLKLRIPALIVVPSFTASKTYYENLKPELDAVGFSVFGQGISGGKQKILEKVEKAERAVLIATPSFLHGVKNLSVASRLVFVLRFPFAPSFSALSKAREFEYGSSAFMNYSLPQGVHLFRSIFFYLMGRATKDKRSLVLLDSRIGTARYGEAIMNSLPKHHTEKLEKDEVSDWLASWLA